MIAVLLAFACTSNAPSAGEDSYADKEAMPPPGAPVAFDEVVWGEAGGAVADDPDSIACVTTFVEALSSEAALKSIRTSWLYGWELPTIDWESQSVLVAYIDLCTTGKNDLEMTDVWDTGSGTLQVDLTFHRGAFGTAEVVRPFSIATVPHGDYVATANVTESFDDTGFGSR